MSPGFCLFFVITVLIIQLVTRICYAYKIFGLSKKKKKKKGVAKYNCHSPPWVDMNEKLDQSLLLNTSKRGQEPGNRLLYSALNATRRLKDNQ